MGVKTGCIYFPVSAFSGSFIWWGSWVLFTPLLVALSMSVIHVERRRQSPHIANVPCGVARVHGLIPFTEFMVLYFSVFFSCFFFLSTRFFNSYFCFISLQLCAIQIIFTVFFVYSVSSGFDAFSTFQSLLSRVTFFFSVLAIHSQCTLLSSIVYICCYLVTKARTDRCLR